ncbi:hypothetical protein [Cognaticolwellia mytili]|uniref:hypothetical protein n=1 Tax=Cognaticolwellia mytili TaxID=1888913 RepID=UPI000A17051D|nr:hypothetical protein [Cognaticolwellia mytili]
MKNIIKLSLFTLGTLASNLTIANEISPDFLKKEIALAHTQYLKGTSDSGLYALKALARILESDNSSALQSEVGPNSLSFTYLRIGLLHESLGDLSKAGAYFDKAINLYKDKHVGISQLKAFVARLDEMSS